MIIVTNLFGCALKVRSMVSVVSMMCKSFLDIQHQDPFLALINTDLVPEAILCNNGSTVRGPFQNDLH